MTAPALHADGLLPPAGSQPAAARSNNLRLREVARCIVESTPVRRRRPS